MDNHPEQSLLKRYLYRFLWVIVVLMVLGIGAWVSLAFWVQLPLSNLAKYIAIAGWWSISTALLTSLFYHLKEQYLKQKTLNNHSLQGGYLGSQNHSTASHGAQHQSNTPTTHSSPAQLTFKTRFYQKLFVYVIGIAGVLIWWQTIEPKQNRAWAEDVSRQVQVEQHGNIVTLHNVRNFDWRTETDFSPRWETRQYDLRQLASLDVITSYWMGPEIAHVLLSFGFDNGEYLTFSIETRREKTESFSTIGGFFRKYELSLIAADERDIIYTRTNVRGEQVYLYRMDLAQKNIRSLFESYLDEAEQLKQKPRFYNTLTSNCTTVVFDMARLIDPGLPIDYRIILSGYLPEYIHEHHGFDPRIPLATLKARAHINPYAAHYAKSIDHSSKAYSKAIRQGIIKPVQSFQTTQP